MTIMSMPKTDLNAECGVCIRCLNESGEQKELFPGMFIPVSSSMMVLCAICENKRCPHAADHRHECSGSNEPGQVGSAYEHSPVPQFPSVAAENNPVMRQLFESQFQMYWDDAPHATRRNFALGYASAVQFFFGIEHSGTNA
jgi:hypothetical protein